MPRNLTDSPWNEGCVRVKIAYSGDSFLWSVSPGSVSDNPHNQITPIDKQWTI